MRTRQTAHWYYQARRDLISWIDLELKWYVKDYINDQDYQHLRNNLIDIAAAHARNTRLLRTRAVAKDGQRLLRPQQSVVRAAGKQKTT